MQNLEALKNKGQESIANLIERGKQQPDEVKTWGITAAAGIVGALAVAAVTKGVLAVVGTLANPPVALTVGAIGGGALGWSWMQKQHEGNGTADESGAEAEVAKAAVAETTTEATADSAGTASTEGSA